MPHSPTFTVVSVALPTIRSYCRRCRSSERLECAERFRANANGKLVDIWLLYRCARCDATKNIAVVERAPVHRVDRGLLDAAYDNDAATARRIARDVALLRRAGVAMDGGDDWSIEPPRPTAPSVPGTGVRLRLTMPEPLLVRLDAVAAGALGCTRGAVRDELRVVDGSGRLDTLRLWRTVELGQLRQ